MVPRRLNVSSNRCRPTTARNATTKHVAPLINFRPPLPPLLARTIHEFALASKPKMRVHGFVLELFRDKVVLITGASSGIGRALAGEFARKGARVALVARNAAKLKAVAQSLPGPH